MDDIIDMTSRLVEKGHAYETGDGDVYFAVDSLPKCSSLRTQARGWPRGSDRRRRGREEKEPRGFRAVEGGEARYRRGRRPGASRGRDGTSSAAP